MRRKDRIDRMAQPYSAPAHRLTLNLKGRDEVIGSDIKNRGHGRAI